ncbi:MAG TPA: hypothetical protein VNQ76_14090 [Planctomicrobium sp.]|nr:hypothetical protein [Planctomicrobium sp.]
MISITNITAAVQLYWQASSPVSTPTQFPGVPLDVNGLPAWMEFWLTQGTEPIHRARSGGELNVFIDIHCFSRQSDKRAVFQLADQARNTFTQKLIAIQSVPSPATLVGHLRFFESVTRDLTRESQPDPRTPLQHVVVSFTGHAESMI